MSTRPFPTAVFTGSNIPANGSVTSPIVSVGTGPGHAPSSGYLSVQYAKTGAVTLHFEFSHDGTTWFDKAQLALAAASGLEMVDAVYAPYMRVRAVETAGAPATVTASVCV
jgi:hypothetical protein